MERANRRGRFLSGLEDCCIISKCRHFLQAKSKIEVDPNICDCQPGDKIPSSRIEFFKSNLFDRKEGGVMTIADLSPLPPDEENVSEDEISHDDNVEKDEVFQDDPTDLTYVPHREELRKLSASKNMYDYPESVQSIRRTRSSYDTGFQIMNSQLLDLRSHTSSIEILKFLEEHHLCRSKVFNMAKRYGFAIEEEHLKIFRRNVFVLGDDGKKSEVRQSNGRLKKEEKITLMDQHTKKYLDFFIPKALEKCPTCEECTGNCALAHVHELLSKLTKYDLMEVLLGLSLDGENKNTGPNGGIIRRLEILLGTVIHLFIQLSV